MTVVRGPSVGLNRYTGSAIVGWPHVVQCLENLWSTPIGERVIREDFGNPGTRLLGENMTPANILRYWQIIKIVTDRWEPRFSITSITPAKTTPEEMRLGAIGFVVTGIYRPRGHVGDRTPDRRKALQISLNEDESFLTDLTA